MLTAVRDLNRCRAKELCVRQGWSVHRKVMLSDIPLSEDLLHVNICIIFVFEAKKSWEIFKPKDSLRYSRHLFPPFT